MVRLDVVRLVVAGPHKVWLNGVWQGWLTADDLSTEGFGPLCWVLRNPDVARLGLVWIGTAGRGRAG